MVRCEWDRVTASLVVFLLMGAPAQVAFGAELVTVAGVQGITVPGALGSTGGYLVFNQVSGTWGLYNPAAGGSLLTSTTPLSELSVSSLTTALGGAGGGPHPVCVAWMQMNTPRPPPPPCYTPSFTPFGDVTGICTTSTYCLGQSGPALGGGLIQALNTVAGVVNVAAGINTIAGALSGGGSGGVGIAPGGYSFPTIYQPAGTQVGTSLLISTTSTGLASDLLTALNNPSYAGVPAPTSASGNTSSLLTELQTNTPIVTTTSTTTATSSPAIPAPPYFSVTGALQLTSPRLEITAHVQREEEEGVLLFDEHVGFGSPQSALGRLCGARPWAGVALFEVLALDGFFNGLCFAAGHGIPEQEAGQAEAPGAEIRVEPVVVKKGQTARVFWGSRGVSSCSVVGPGVSLARTFSGADETAPLTVSTTFTIECTVSSATTTTTIRESVPVYVIP